MAKKKISEIWAELTGSYEELLGKLRDKLRHTDVFGNVEKEWDLSLEATFPDYIIVRKSTEDEPLFFQATWKKDDNGDIELSGVKKVTATVAIKAVSESRKALQAAGKIKDLSEIFISPISFDIDEEATAKEGKQVVVGSVKVAQKADTLNRNKRLYPKAVLEAAVEEVQEKIKRFGPLPMDYIHREKEGQNFRNIRETVAAINSVDFNDDDGTVSLEDIRLVETAAGKDIKALLDAKMRLQVSQRGSGLSEIVKNEKTGDIYERVNELHIDSWDFLAGGDASVTEADFEFEVISEAINMEDAKVLTAEDFDKEWNAKADKLKDDVTGSVIDALKTAGVIKEEPPAEKPEEEEAEEEETPDEKPTEEPAEPGVEQEPKTEKAAPDPVLMKQVKDQSKRITEMTSQMNALTKANQLSAIKAIRGTIVNEVFSDKRYEHFTDKEKELIATSVKDELILGAIKDPSDRAVLKENFTSALGTEADKLDQILAIAKLRDTGYPKKGAESGISHVSVMSEGKPWGENFKKLQTATMERMNFLIESAEYRAPEGHPGLKALDEKILERFDELNYSMLREAGEEVTQLDIGPRVALLSRVMIDAAFRTLTALGVYNVGSQVSRIEDIAVKTWLPAEGTADLVTYMNAIHVAEQGTFPMAGVTYANYPIYAIKKGIRTQLTSEAMATAQGTAMNPLADAIAGLAIDIRNRMDLELWYLILAKGFEYGITEVTGYPDCIETSSGVFQLTTDGTVYATGIVPFEWYKVVDANGNPTVANINKLYAIPTASTYQTLLVREAADDNTVLIYDTDYSIDWNTGELTLTGTGETKEANNGLEANFSYTTNIDFWSMVPDAGVQLYSHLINLRQAMGEAKVAVSNRHYNPTLIGLNTNMEVLITSGPQFEASGARASDAIDRLNNVIALLGLSPIRTSALPQDWIPIMERDAGFYRTQRPWSIKGPITSETTGDDFYLAEEYSGNDVPVSAKIALVGIQDLDSPWNAVT